MRRFLRNPSRKILFTPSPSLPKTIAIRAGNVIDPATGKVAQNQIIIIKDQKITDIGPNVAIPAGAQVLDLSNEMKLMPGVIDSHTHVTFLLPNMSTPLEENYLEVSKGMRVLQGPPNRAEPCCMQASPRSATSVTKPDYASVDLCNAINKGWFVGPTILTLRENHRRLRRSILWKFRLKQGAVWRFEYIDADGSLGNSQSRPRKYFLRRRSDQACLGQ